MEASVVMKKSTFSLGQLYPVLCLLNVRWIIQQEGRAGTDVGDDTANAERKRQRHGTGHSVKLGRLGVNLSKVETFIVKLIFEIMLKFWI